MTLQQIAFTSSSMPIGAGTHVILIDGQEASLASPYYDLSQPADMIVKGNRYKIGAEQIAYILVDIEAIQQVINDTFGISFPLKAGTRVQDKYGNELILLEDFTDAFFTGNAKYLTTDTNVFDLDLRGFPASSIRIVYANESGMISQQAIIPEQLTTSTTQQVAELKEFQGVDNSLIPLALLFLAFSFSK